jgi:hypothetical protein
MSSRTKIISLSDCIAFVAILALTPSAFADITTFDFEITPSYQGDAGSNFVGFDVFTVAVGGANTPSLPNACVDATIRQTTAGAIITSTMNIYHPFSVPQFVLEAGVRGDAQEVLLQLQTFGNPLSTTSFVLEYDNGSGPVTLAPTDQGFLGAGVDEYYVRFDLESVPAIVSDFEIRWAASAANHSLDVALLDVRSDAEILVGDATDVSLSAGGTQNLAIEAGADNANGFYFVFGSATGTGPTDFLGVDVPLTLDSYTLFAYQAANGGALQNFAGFLDDCGAANAAIVVPSGTNASLAGITLFHAAVVFDAFGAIDLASNAVSLDLLL